MALMSYAMALGKVVDEFTSSRCVLADRPYAMVCMTPFYT